MPSRKAWITPDEIPTDTLCRVLLIPNDEIFYANVVGALLPLCYPDNWEQVGMVTPAEAADAAKVMFDAFVSSECVNVQIDTLSYRLAQNTNGGGITANVNTKCHLNSFIGVSTGNVTIPSSDDVLVIQPGLYLITYNFVFSPSSGYVVLRFMQEAGQEDLIIELESDSVGSSVNFAGSFNVNVLAAQSWAFRILHGTTVANTFFGSPANRSGIPEVYATVSFVRLGDAS